MKKTFRFAALLCLMIATVLTVASCTPVTILGLPLLGLFESTEETILEETTPEATSPEETTPEETTPEETTPEETTPEQTTPEETTPPEPVDPDKPEGAVLVDSINGKSFSECIENFAKGFRDAQSYDWSASREIIENGTPVFEYVSLKLYNNEFAAYMQLDGALTELCFVDGILYTNNNGQKMKLTIDDPEELLGEGYIDGLKNANSNFPEFPKDEADEMNATNIYLLNNVYYVTVHETDEESGEEVSICFQFNAVGEFIRMEGKSEAENYTFVVNSYNRPVNITPPENAKEYAFAGNMAVPEGAIPVQLLNGMNATELFEKFVQEYATSKAFDIKVSATQTENEQTMSATVTVKYNEEALYYDMTMEGQTMKVWIVDGIGYVNYNGQKIKQEGLDIDELIGEGALESAILSVISEIPEAYYTNLAEAQLYYLNGVYFFTIVLYQSGVGTVTEIVMFNANGEVTRIIDKTENLSSDYTVYSYGKPVEILPPEDADEYVAEGETPDNNTPTLPQTQDEIYALYSNMCLALQNANSYNLYLFVDDVAYLDYLVEGQNAYVLFYETSGNLERWIIDGIGYYRDSGVTIYRTQLTESFLNIFASVESILPIGIVDKESMSNLRCTYDADYGEIVVWFDIVWGDGEVTQCKYALFESEGYSYIEVIYTFTKDGEVVEEDYYFFDCINDPEIKVELP